MPDFGNAVLWCFQRRNWSVAVISREDRADTLLGSELRPMRPTGHRVRLPYLAVSGIVERGRRAAQWIECNEPGIAPILATVTPADWRNDR
ncbi:hypothetical protein [Streptomyces sp. NPDC002533]